MCGFYIDSDTKRYYFNSIIKACETNDVKKINVIIKKTSKWEKLTDELLKEDFFHSVRKILKSQSYDVFEYLIKNKYISKEDIEKDKNLKLMIIDEISEMLKIDNKNDTLYCVDLKNRQIDKFCNFCNKSENLFLNVFLEYCKNEDLLRDQCNIIAIVEIALITNNVNIITFIFDFLFYNDIKIHSSNFIHNLPLNNVCILKILANFIKNTKLEVNRHFIQSYKSLDILYEKLNNNKTISLHEFNMSFQLSFCLGNNDILKKLLKSFPDTDISTYTIKKCRFDENLLETLLQINQYDVYNIYPFLKFIPKYNSFKIINENSLRKIPYNDNVHKIVTHNKDISNWRKRLKKERTSRISSDVKKYFNNETVIQIVIDCENKHGIFYFQGWFFLCSRFNTDIKNSYISLNDMFYPNQWFYDFVYKNKLLKPLLKIDSFKQNLTF